MATLLTIGELAVCAGVTVRAIRHYHQRGLLAEPDRDSSGYRRYGADAVVELIRIRTLADAGVPLARVGDLLGAQPAVFASTITAIDDALARKITELEHQRDRIRALHSGDRLVLPDAVADYLHRLHVLGVRPQTEAMERDGWVLLHALAPNAPIETWAREKIALLDDPRFRDLCLRCDQAFGWTASDPRLPALARDLLACSDSDSAVDPAEADRLLSDARLTGLVAQSSDASPGWRRLNELVDQLIGQRTGRRC